MNDVRFLHTKRWIMHASECIFVTGMTNELLFIKLDRTIEVIKRHISFKLNSVQLLFKWYLDLTITSQWQVEINTSTHIEFNIICYITFKSIQNKPFHTIQIYKKANQFITIPHHFTVHLKTNEINTTHPLSVFLQGMPILTFSNQNWQVSALFPTWYPMPRFSCRLVSTKSISCGDKSRMPRDKPTSRK